MLLSSVIYFTVLCVSVTALMHQALAASPQDPRVSSSPSSEPQQCDHVGLPPPDHPFKVVWNHPDPCEKSGIHLDLSNYGFTFNKGRVFIGDQIQTLYRTGLWPRYSGGRAIDGGLPQLVNDTAFTRTWSDLSHNRVTNFTGLAVLDWETWRPNFNTNFGSLKRYKTESINLVKRRHPEYNSHMVNTVAALQWERGARRIMSAKLAIGQAIMPGGHWGYYHYPRAWAGNSSPAQNNRMDWLWRKATGLYPSIYLTNPNQTRAAKVNRVVREVKEAVRIQNKFSPPNTPVYPYSNLQQGPFIFFQADHLEVTLGVPADMGASGIVLWGSSSYYRQHGQCNRLRQHIRTVLGPFVRNLTQFMSDCSTALCGGHGRCVRNDRDCLLNVTTSKNLSAQCTSRDSRFRDYHCRCYSYWRGACCQTHSPPPCKQQQQNQHTQGPISTQQGQTVTGIKPRITPNPQTNAPLIGR